MRTVLKSLTLLVVLLLPATVFAQASLTGTVRDASGAVLPGVTVEAASPALIEKVRTATTDGSGQYRIVDLRAGHLLADVHAARLQRRQAGQHRADRFADADDSRRHESRRHRGDDYGHRRVAGRRRAERASRGRHRQRLDPVDPRVTCGGCAAQRDARPDGGWQRHRAVADDDVLLCQRRRQQRRAHGRERHDRRRGAQRRRLVVRLRCGRRRGSLHPRWRRAGRDGYRRPDHEHRPALGRQHVRGHRVHEPRRRLVARRQPQRRAPRPRPDRDARDHPGARRQLFTRRPDSSRPSLVLRAVPQPRYADGCRRHHRERECRQRGPMGLDVEPGERAAGAGPHDGDGTVCRAGGPEPLQRQLRVPEALRGHAAGRRDRGLSQPRRGLGRPRHDHAVAGGDRHGGARLLRVAVPSHPDAVDDAGHR